MSPKARLAAAVVLFVGWIGYLAYLVARTRDPVILSRPQFFAAPLHVVASLTGDADHPEPRVTVKEVLYGPPDEKGKLSGRGIAVESLQAVGAEQGWAGPGEYLLPLEREKGGYRLVPIPPTPTFMRERLRIYRATADARAQLEAIESLLP